MRVWERKASRMWTEPVPRITSVHRLITCQSAYLGQLERRKSDLDTARWVKLMLKVNANFGHAFMTADDHRSVTNSREENATLGDF